MLSVGAKTTCLASLFLVRIINLPLDIISASINVNMFSQLSLCRGKRSPVCRIFQRQQRCAAPTASNLREEPVLNMAELGTIRRIMNKKKPDTQFVGKIHKVLLDDSVCAGVRTASIAQDDESMGIRVLSPQVLPPYSCDVVSDKPGGVMADSHCHIPHILGDALAMGQAEDDYYECLDNCN